MSTRILVLWLSAVFVACESPITVDDGGVLAGRVQLIDSAGSPLVFSHDVEVSIEGSTIQTRTDSSGWYRLKSLSAGTYAIGFAKPGYGKFVLHQQSFVGRDTAFLRVIKLNRSPSSRIQFDSIQLSKVDTTWNVNFYFQRQDNQKKPASFWGVDSAEVLASDLAVNLDGWRSMLTKRGFKKGDRVFVALSDVVQSTTDCEYYDPFLRMDRFASTGPKSTVLNFELP